MLEVRDNPDRSEFEAYLDRRRIGKLTYIIDGPVITLLHTEIQSQYERHGYGTALVTQALDLVRDTGMSVVPRCEFATAVIKDHPEYADLVKEV
jgi:uncharacterized protein